MADYTLSSGNVFKDLELPSPNERLAKAKLAYKINRLIADHRMTQEEAAQSLGISRSKMKDLRNGRLERFSIDLLLSLLENLNHHFQTQETSINEAIIEYWHKLREACLANAEELVNSAKTLKGKSTAHIRYHLAVLAMEEVGKAVLLSIEFGKLTLDEGYLEPNLTIDDHVKKLFWAIFTPFFEQKRLTKEDFESYRGFAKDLHGRRLESLYTDPHEPLLPQDRVEDEEADSVMKLAESRINIEKAHDIPHIPDQTRLEDFHWFHTAADDPEKRRLIFGNASWDKLVEFGDVHEWIKWIRQEFTKAEEESEEILRQEMEKGAAGEIEGEEPKWRVNFRIYSASHSIRPKALNKWNENYGYFIKIHSSNEKRRDELICELTLGKKIPVQALWNTAKEFSRDFVAALNIATKGLFWWHVDKDISRFYEKIWDLENDAEARINISPELAIDWGHLALKEEDLRNTGFILGYILETKHFNQQMRTALEMYLTGLALISKTDIHVRFEPNAFEHFFQALKTLLLASGDWDGVEDLRVTAANQLSEGFSTMPSLNEYIELGMQLEKRNNFPKRITLTETIGMKLYCDAYLSLLAKKRFNDRTERNL